jgi:hypothetical protein
MTGNNTRKTCECGCGEATTATYRPGHDARHKSQLIATALKGGAMGKAAEKKLADKGWTRFLDRKREIVLATGEVTDLKPLKRTRNGAEEEE